MDIFAQSCELRELLDWHYRHPPDNENEHCDERNNVIIAYFLGFWKRGNRFESSSVRFMKGTRTRDPADLMNVSTKTEKGRRIEIIIA